MIPLISMCCSISLILSIFSLVSMRIHLWQKMVLLLVFWVIILWSIPDFFTTSWSRCKPIVDWLINCLIQFFPWGIIELISLWSIKYLMGPTIFYKWLSLTIIISKWKSAWLKLSLLFDIWVDSTLINWLLVACLCSPILIGCICSNFIFPIIILISLLSQSFVLVSQNIWLELVDFPFSSQLILIFIINSLSHLIPSINWTLLTVSPISLRSH